MAARAGVPALDGGGRERCDRRTKRPQIDAPGRAAHHVCCGTSCRRHVPREPREIGGTWEGKDRKKEKKEKKEKEEEEDDTKDKESADIEGTGPHRPIPASNAENEKALF